MKKNLALLMALLILLQSGLVFWISTSAIIIHKEVRRKSNPSNLTYLTLTNFEFNKCKLSNHEILFNGKYYDLYRIKLNGNKTFIAASEDLQETILTKIAQVFKHENNTEFPNSDLIKFVFSIYILHSINFDFKAPIFYNTSKYFYIINLNKGVTLPPFLPPEFL